MATEQVAENYSVRTEQTAVNHLLQEPTNAETQYSEQVQPDRYGVRLPLSKYPRWRENLSRRL